MYIPEIMASRPRSPAHRSAPTEGDAAASASPTYTIDELTAQTGVPSRTIRFYQSKGALMPPTIVGRVASYGTQHVQRLALIAQLQERGLRIDAIRELVKRIERGELDLAEWLGVERALTSSWAHDQARTVSEAELFALAGSERTGLIADLLRVKLIERRGDVYLVESPALLAVAMKLEAAGIDQATLAEGAAILRKHLGRAVSELSELLLERARRGGLALDRAPAELLEALRPTGLEAVRILFAKEAERVMRKLAESGALAALGKGSRRRR